MKRESIQLTIGEQNRVYIVLVWKPKFMFPKKKKATAKLIWVNL